ncbi:Mitochondrial intermediate peptidase [Mycena indigotica]|uniref:mitochondrial intermediate peptidase n=1 Tax=Mycena indigotica TaxID=2126181 RepID=A0A8H6SXB9_9AGAR|nr:Mitochondrial intermediate peptidase [Mycena indigotica]KAF7307084.1 Mitochondrial intermediate peptidase [Mycena indigotica]
MLSQPATRVVGRLFKSPSIKLEHYYRYAHTIPATADDRALKEVFDQSRGTQSSSGPPTGLFGHRTLTSPDALFKLADATVLRAQLLTKRILRARESRRELSLVIKNIDRLYSLVAGVTNAAELIENSHPDEKWAEAAGAVHRRLRDYTNTLNGHAGILAVQTEVLDNPSLMKSFSPETRATALRFARDELETSPRRIRKSSALSTKISSLGLKYLHGAVEYGDPPRILPAHLEGLDDWLGFPDGLPEDGIIVNPGSQEAEIIMRIGPDAEARRQLYIASNTSPPGQIETLHSMLRARGQLARVSGKSSYAEFALMNNMLKTPKHVEYFLDTLLNQTRPATQKALDLLRTQKQAYPTAAINAWDIDFYAEPEPEAFAALPNLTLGTVFMGLSRLLRHIYGISLRVADVPSSEFWHPDVTKLEVVDEKEGVIGWIYADLFARPGKVRGAAAHFLRPSRRTDDDDEAGDGVTPELQKQIKVSQEFDAHGRRAFPGRERVYQLPIGALFADFLPPTAEGDPPELVWQEVKMLWHEMGHAMHFMLSRPDFYSTSVSACPTDFVEFPSTLMEHFLTSTQVFSLFDSGSIDEKYLADPFPAIHTHQQILLAMLDQAYHSPKALENDFDSTAELRRIYDQYSLIPHVPGATPQTRFRHLGSSPVSYYGYLFDQAITGKVWRDIFSRDPLDRAAGERLRREVLSWGASKDAWKMLSELLRMPELESGGVEAIKEVGSWSEDMN